MVTMATDSPYRSLYRLSFFACLVMLVVIPLQIVVFVIKPVPLTSMEWLRLFDSDPLVGIFHADFFILVNNILISVLYLAFYHLLKDTNRGLLQLGLLVGFLGIAAYLSSNKTFELLSLAREYKMASLESEKLILLAATKSLTLGWQGTAFDTYYVLNGIALLVISVLMFQSPRFSKLVASFGLASAILMVVPSTAGVVGLVFSLLSLVPWYLFTIFNARTFYQLGMPRAPND